MSSHPQHRVSLSIAGSGAASDHLPARAHRTGETGGAAQGPEVHHPARRRPREGMLLGIAGSSAVADHLAARAHRNGATMEFAYLQAQLSGGRYGLAVTDITDAFLDGTLGEYRIGDEAHRCFALDGSFALSVPVADKHPVVRALVALGFDERDVLDGIATAVARASLPNDGDDE